MRTVKRVVAHNFKSFRDVDVTLNDFDVIIGSNASGKSNFLQIFKFIRDCVLHGVGHAIFIQGGMDELKNANCGLGESVKIMMQMEGSFISIPFCYIEGTGEYTAEIMEVKYSFEVNAKKKEPIKVKDELCMRLQVFELIDEKDKIESSERTRKRNKIPQEIFFDIFIKPTKSSVSTRINYDKELFKEKGFKMHMNKDIFKIFAKSRDSDNLPLLGILSFCGVLNIIKDFSILTVGPEYARSGAKREGAARLEIDGSNLPLLLRKFSSKDREEFHQLVSSMIPSIEKVYTEDMGDKSVLLKTKEIYFNNKSFAGPFLSDGTINIITLVYAMYFDLGGLEIIEEPEKGLHPALIRKLVEMMKDASEKKQILVTTHNPLMLRQMQRDNVLVVTRGDDGNSYIGRYEERGELDKFLIEEIGLDEMMIEGMLGGPNA